MKKMFWLCLGITFCLTACQNAGQPETEVTVDFSVLEGETAAPEGEKDEEKQIYGRSAFLNKIREQEFQTEDGLRLCLYTYSKEGFAMFPGSGTLICTMEDGSTPEAVMDMSTHISGIERPEQGFLKGSYREQQYRIPGDGNVISAIYQIKQPLISSDEKSKTITIPIPEREGHLEEKIEFQDCTLYLTRIKNSMNGMTTGRIKIIRRLLSLWYICLPG